MPFASLKLHPSLQKGLKELGFQRPTPIQAESIPAALEGRDILACAMTGSGKTAAFLLPILDHLIGKPRGKTRALVLTPTRELAAQILAALDAMAVHTPATAAAIYRGGPGPGSTLATLIGWKAAGWRGALVVSLAFFLPSSLLIYGVGRVWNRWRGSA